MRFAGLAPPKHDTRHSKETALEHPTFLTSVMALWDKSLDTNEIAKAMFEHEYVVAFCLRIGRERRRGQAEWSPRAARGRNANY